MQAGRDKEKILDLIDSDNPTFGIDGKFSVKLRIEEVSRNHGSRDFVIRIAPKNQNNIAPVLTTAITVKSKRTTKKEGGTKRKSSGSSDMLRTPLNSHHGGTYLYIYI